MQHESANMSQSNTNWRKTKNSRSSARARRGISFRFFERAKANPNSALPVDPHDENRADNPLKHFDQWPGGHLPEGLSKEDMIFIEMGKTQRSRAIKGLNELETNYLAHTFNVSTYYLGEGEGDAMYEHLENDPWGETVPPLSDTRCWDMRAVAALPAPVSASTRSKSAFRKRKKAKKGKGKGKSKGKKGKGKKARAKPTEGTADAASATLPTIQSDEDSSSDNESDDGEIQSKQPVPSTFYQNLRSLQDSYYKYLRAGVAMHMDKPAKEAFIRLVKQAESDMTPPLSLKDCCNRDRRLTWKFLRNLILQELCTFTLGSYHFKPLLTMHRKDNETLFDWSTRVQKCQAGITEHGHGWEAIGTGEAVAKLWE